MDDYVERNGINGGAAGVCAVNLSIARDAGGSES